MAGETKAITKIKVAVTTKAITKIKVAVTKVITKTKVAATKAARTHLWRSQTLTLTMTYPSRKGKLLILKVFFEGWVSTHYLPLTLPRYTKQQYKKQKEAPPC